MPEFIIVNKKILRKKTVGEQLNLIMIGSLLAYIFRGGQ